MATGEALDAAMEQLRTAGRRSSNVGNNSRPTSARGERPSSALARSKSIADGSLRGRYGLAYFELWPLLRQLDAGSVRKARAWTFDTSYIMLAEVEGPYLLWNGLGVRRLGLET